MSAAAHIAEVPGEKASRSWVLVHSLARAGGQAGPAGILTPEPHLLSYPVLTVSRAKKKKTTMKQSKGSRMLFRSYFLSRY